jgi:serine/threonine protein kinase/Flp pilus assembly protein TadD
MRAEDWPRVEELFHVALALGGAERDAYLVRECGGDAGLRGEVESLVAAFESERSFIERPALSFGMRVLSEGLAGSLVGSTVGHYKVVRPLGQGGMGEVYLADDSVLERPVALKFISGGLVGDEWAREQLTQEARAVARLEHPNICAVYGFEEDDGRHFIVMQYVEGETLSTLLRASRPDAKGALDLAEQIASALAAAHARGVVHRDVKPQNIVVTADGQAKVLDFGLAKFVRPPQQQPGAATRAGTPGVTAHAGLVLGTLAYMSPEQARGEALDCRSDIFSLGVLLHEMLTGRNPFLRETEEETVEAVKGEEVPPLDCLPQPLRGRVERVTRKCLAKDRALRYETADELLRDLRSARAPRLPLKRIAAVALALVLALASFAAYVYVKMSKVHTLAVLPITNASEDPEGDYLSKGLTRDLFDKFSYLPRLRIKLPSVAPPGTDEGDRLLRAGRELQADAVLSGSIVKQDGSLRLRLTLLDTANASPMWDAAFDLRSANVFALQDEVTREVSAKLGLWLIGNERSLLTKRQTESDEAMHLYMEGQSYYMKRDRDNVQKAIDLFERARELDHSFAKAYAGLAVSYVLAANVASGPLLQPKLAMEKARWNARQALETGPLLPEAHASMGLMKMSYMEGRQEAEQEFRRAIELDPDYAQARYWYSNLLAASGRFDESIRESEIARSLDPYSPIAEMNYGRALYYARRFDEAETYFRRLLETSPDNKQFQHMAGYLFLRQGHYDEGVAILEKLHAEDPLYGTAALGYAYGKVGRYEEARATLRELDELSTQERPVPQFEKAVVYIGMGDRDAAFAMLERAYQEQFGQLLIYLTIDPIYDDLRADPRYADLVRRINQTP